MELSYSIIVPVHNGERIINETIFRLCDKLENHSLNIDSYEIIIIENGSIDDTQSVLSSYKNNKNIKILTLEIGDLGLAIRKGIECASYERLIYLPADLSYNESFINKAIENMDTFRVVYGSKFITGAISNRSKLREVLSFGFNILSKILFNFKIKDTQGVKAFFRSDFYETTKFFPKGFLWDIGFCHVQREKNLSWVEVPCDVYDNEKTSTLNKFRTTIKMFLGLISYRFSKNYRLIKKLS